jgi:hypothetical protein
MAVNWPKSRYPANLSLLFTSGKSLIINVLMDFHVMPGKFGMPTAHCQGVRDAAQHPECVLAVVSKGIQDDDEKND